MRTLALAMRPHLAENSHSINAGRDNFDLSFSRAFPYRRMSRCAFRDYSSNMPRVDEMLHYVKKCR